MDQIVQLKKRIALIEKRNHKVELDKAWEISKTRKFFLALFTYIILGLYMWAIDVKHPMLNALIPTFGFLLSTLTLPFFRKIWERLAN